MVSGSAVRLAAASDSSSWMSVLILRLVLVVLMVQLLSPRRPKLASGLELLAGNKKPRVTW